MRAAVLRAGALAFAAALAGISPAAEAQDGGGFLAAARETPQRPIQLGDEVSDALTTTDPRLSDETHFRVWRFTGGAGQEVVARLTSSDFRSFLMLGAVRDGSLELLESGGPGGGSSAELAIALPSAGDYVLVANTVNPGETGAYTLSLRSLADACAAGGLCSIAGRRSETIEPTEDPIVVAAPTARPITLGESREGVLTASDPRMGDSSHFQVWSYQGSAGERIVIDHSSSDFDAYLILGLRTADSVRQIHRNDDGPNGLDSQLAVELPETATYLMVANTFRANATGQYRITLRSMEEACAAGGPCAPGDASRRRSNPLAAVATATAGRIALNQPVQARLTESDPQIRSGSPFHAYRFAAGAGDTVALHMTSSDFDSYLYLARLNGSEVEQIDYDDDSGGNRNSFITARIADAGEYLAVATTFSAGDSGSYSLTVQRMADACASLGVCEIGASLARVAGNRAVLSAPSRPIAVGQRASGTLGDGVAQLPEGRPFEAWRYTARAGERIVVSNRSPDFDAYLYVYRVTGSGVEEIERDDDSGGDRHAEINTALAPDGDYLILASAYSSSARGTYELSVQTLADACAAGGPCAAGETSASVGRLQTAAGGPHVALRSQQPVTGRLEESMPTLPDRGRYQTYRFSGTAGERLVLAMNSSDFDPYLYLTQLAGGRLRQIATDDDGGPGTNARLVATLPETGEYVVIAAAYGSTGVGEYTVEMGPCDDACAAADVDPSNLLPSERTFENVLQAERRTLPPDGVVESALTAGDPAMNDGAHFHAYWFDAAAATRIEADMRAAGFDTYLTLLRQEGDSLVRVAFDDDGGEGTNSLLEWTVEQPGMHVLVATSFGAGRTGSYTLRVEFSGGPAGQRREAARD